MMKPVNRVLLIAFICATGFCKAQTGQDAMVIKQDTTKPVPLDVVDTNIRVIANPAVRNTINKVEQYQQASHGTFSGYRVQVHFGSDRNGASSARTDFQLKYPSFSSYLTYQQPYFKVCIGDFRSKLEATSALNKIKKDYPGAFVVRDKINPPPLH
ncbi:MAG TPA: SPOR domain-containing protein [Bacteroidia bacterium]|nr:SPOR domain-containing protein [Bacteroidia bacterium]